MTPPTIGVFDSGFGGLTVLRALAARLPGARFAFLGDTARLPYGSKSRRTIARYAVQSAQFLVREQGAEFLVIACNTASALALETSGRPARPAFSSVRRSITMHASNTRAPGLSPHRALPSRRGFSGPPFPRPCTA